MLSAPLCALGSWGYHVPVPDSSLTKEINAKPLCKGKGAAGLEPSAGEADGGTTTASAGRCWERGQRLWLLPGSPPPWGTSH